MATSNEDEICCRICRLEVDPTDPEDEPMCTPCKCSGSIAHVHQTCLEQWLVHQGVFNSGEAKCELCHFQFIFDPTYIEGTPDILSISEILNAGLSEMCSVVLKMLKVVLALLIWVCLLPLSLSHTYFWLQDRTQLSHSSSILKKKFNRSPPYFIPSELPSSFSEVMSDIQLGFFLAGAVLLCGLAFLAFVDYYRVHLEEEEMKEQQLNAQRNENQAAQHVPVPVPRNEQTETMEEVGERKEPDGALQLNGSGGETKEAFEQNTPAATTNEHVNLPAAQPPAAQPPAAQPPAAQPPAARPPAAQPPAGQPLDPDLEGPFLEVNVPIADILGFNQAPHHTLRNAFCAYVVVMFCLFVFAMMPLGFGRNFHYFTTGKYYMFVNRHQTSTTGMNSIFGKISSYAYYENKTLFESNTFLPFRSFLTKLTSSTASSFTRTTITTTATTTSADAVAATYYYPMNIDKLNMAREKIGLELLNDFSRHDQLFKFHKRYRLTYIRDPSYFNEYIAELSYIVYHKMKFCEYTCPSNEIVADECHAFFEQFSANIKTGQCIVHNKRRLQQKSNTIVNDSSYSDNSSVEYEFVGRWWSWLKQERWWNVPTEGNISGIFHYVRPSQPRRVSTLNSNSFHSPVSSKMTSSSFSNSSQFFSYSSSPSWTCPWGAMALLFDDSLTLIIGYLTLGAIFVYIPLTILNIVDSITYDEDYENNRPDDDEESFFEMITSRLEDITCISKMTQLFLVKMVLFPLCLGAVLRLSSLGLFETGENVNSFTYFISTIVGSPVVTGLALQWVIGIAFMLLVTVLLLELREVLHPDVFDGIIRVPDDQHLLLSLIEDSYFHHIVRIFKSTMVYGTIIAIIFYSPTWVLRNFFRVSLFDGVFPIPFPTYYIWTTGQVAAEVVVAHVIVLQSVDPLKGFLYNTMGGGMGFLCDAYGLREYLMPLAADAEAVAAANAEIANATMANDAVEESKESNSNNIPLENIDNREGLFVRGAPPRKPWQTWKAPDDANEHGHRFGYVEDPETGESKRVLLAKRIPPTCCYIRIFLLFFTCWMLLLAVLGMSFVAIEIIIHLPVWAFSLPQFMFHAPATFLLVVYVGIKCRASLNKHLNPPELNDGARQEAEQGAGQDAEQDTQNNGKNNDEKSKLGEETKLETPLLEKDNENNNLPDTCSTFLLNLCFMILIIAWSFAAILLGAGVSKFSLRLQQIHAMGNSTNEEIRLLLPTSFFHQLFNIRNFLSGFWLLDLFFCLHVKGLYLMLKWSDMYKSSEANGQNGMKKAWLLSRYKLIKSVGLTSICVGAVGSCMLLFLEWDRVSTCPGFKILCVTYMIVAYCVYIFLKFIYSYKNTIIKIMVSFHDTLRDKKYRSGVRLRALERSSAAAK
jgi:hypothetical protein